GARPDAEAVALGHGDLRPEFPPGSVVTSPPTPAPDLQERIAHGRRYPAVGFFHLGDTLGTAVLSPPPLHPIGWQAWRPPRARARRRARIRPRPGRGADQFRQRGRPLRHGRPRRFGRVVAGRPLRPVRRRFVPRTPFPGTPHGSAP